MSSRELIQQIVTYHPAFEAGKKRGWSNWLGGMTGRGDWDYLKLIFAPHEELQDCLNELIAENEGIDYRFNEHYMKSYSLDKPVLRGIEFTLKDGTKEFIANKANIEL